MAHMLYALGHVLHLNQDLSQPGHVRNDNHAFKRWIEQYGIDTYYKQPASIAFPTVRAPWYDPSFHRGWLDYGFQKLEDFWDRRKYTGNPQALNDDANPVLWLQNKKLGLAEFSNGNFLGEDATYAEDFDSGGPHYFPYPSRLTSTDFLDARWQIWMNRAPVTLRDGMIVQSIFLRKIAGGVHFRHHSQFRYLSARHPENPVAHRVENDIHNANVLKDYHDILIPKAIEYSAGILDYFFRGRLELQCHGQQSGGSEVQFCIRNKSGQELSPTSSSDGFELNADDANENRSRVTGWPGVGLGVDAERLFTFTAPSPAPSRYVLVFKGTIGKDNSGNPLDLVDAGIAIAALTFTVPQQPLPGCTGLGEKRVVAIRRWHGAWPFAYDTSSATMPLVRYCTATGHATWSKTIAGGPSASATVDRSSSVGAASGRVDGTGTDAVTGLEGDYNSCLYGVPLDFQKPGAIALGCGLAHAGPTWLDAIHSASFPPYLFNGGAPPEHGVPSIDRGTTTPTYIHRVISYPYTDDLGQTHYHLFYESEWYASGSYWSTEWAWNFDNQTRVWSQVVARHESASYTATSSQIAGSDMFGNSWNGTGGLSGANSWDMVNDDLDQLLSTWDMTDDELLPWNSFCGDGILVTRKEGMEAAPAVSGLAGTWTTPPAYPPGYLREGFAEGAVIGAPVSGPGPYLDPDYGTLSPFPHATQWLSGREGVYTEPGALVRCGSWFDGTVLKAKWASQKDQHPPGNGDFVFASGSNQGSYLTAVEQGNAPGGQCARAVMAVTPNGERFSDGKPFPSARPLPLMNGSTVWFGICYSTMWDSGSGQYVEARADTQVNWPVPLANAQPPGCFDSGYYPPR